MPTVNPVVDEQGNYLGSTISHHGADAATDNSGRVKGWQNDYYEDNQGETHHRFSEAELRDEGGDFNFESYTDALMEATPNLRNAISWASNNPVFSEAELADYNQAIQNEDLGAINAFIERLLPLYEEASETSDVEDSSEEPEEFDETDYYLQLEESGVIDETLDELIAEDYVIDSEGEQQLSAVLESFPEGSAEHAIAEMGLRIADGSIDMTEAIELVTQQFGDAAAATAYFRLQSIMN
jgi:uncharacterized LabA/DUF88 family protein